MIIRSCAFARTCQFIYEDLGIAQNELLRLLAIEKEMEAGHRDADNLIRDILSTYRWIEKLQEELKKKGCKEINCTGDGNRVCWEIPYPDISFVDCELNPDKCCDLDCTIKKSEMIIGAWQGVLDAINKLLKQFDAPPTVGASFVGKTAADFEGPNSIALGQQIVAQFEADLDFISELHSETVFFISIEGTCGYKDTEKVCENKLKLNQQGDPTKFDLSEVYGKGLYSIHRSMRPTYIEYLVTWAGQNFMREILGALKSARERFRALQRYAELIAGLRDKARPIIQARLDRATREIATAKEAIKKAKLEKLNYSGEDWRENTRQQALKDIKQAYMTGMRPYPIKGKLQYYERKKKKGIPRLQERDVRANTVSEFIPDDPLGCIVAKAPETIDNLNNACNKEKEENPGFLFPIKVEATWEMRGKINLPDYLQKKLNLDLTKEISLGTQTATDCKGAK